MPEAVPSGAVKSRVQSVSKALRILEILANSPDGEMSVSQVAKELGWHRTTVYRFMQTLVDEGFVRYLPAGERYHLTFKIVELANQLVNRLDIRRVARPHLLRLVEKWQINAHLGVMEGGQVVFIDRLECDKPLRTHFHIGRRAPIHATAVGKALLAEMEPGVALELVRKAGWQRYTAQTICDEEVFLRELAEIRRAGYSVDRGEHNQGVACVAAVVRDVTGGAVGGISLSGAAEEILGQDVEAMGQSVRETAEFISVDLGWQKP
ncbi:MAG TPA: IclR family transcriptional regulator [Firmicutes bacterium]|nr:IclR family transcriptional regulator [Bacillota bacterium]